MRRRTALCSLAVGFARPAFALYDAAPDAALAAVQGAWTGTLTYRDYSRPDRLVTLPTRLFVALAAPDDLVLHYVFDDGPGKTVYSYERMAFDFAAAAVSWTSGGKTAVSRIAANAGDAGARRLRFEREDGGRTERHTMELSAPALTLAKDEVDAGGVATFRNRFEFRRNAL